MILGLSVALLLLHQLLDLNFLPNEGLGLLVKLYLHMPSYDYYPFQLLCPNIPWIGVMGLGWCFGIYLNRLDNKRIRKLTKPIAFTGVISLVAFVVIRWLNGYGSLIPRQANTIPAWLAISKYPPDLAYLTITLGGMCLLISLVIWMENLSWFGSGVTGVILVFGRTPLFFYVTHLVLYRVRPFYTPIPLFRRTYRQQ